MFWFSLDTAGQLSQASPWASVSWSLCDTLGSSGQLSQLSAGDFIELEAFDDGSGVINAVEIERKAPDEIKIVGPVEAWDEASRSVTLLGIDFDLSAATYENELEQNISAAAFYGALSQGEFVKIKDADSNGVFEKAELDD